MQLADDAVQRRFEGVETPFRIPVDLWEDVQDVHDGLIRLLSDSLRAWDALHIRKEQGWEPEDLNVQVETWLFELRRAVVSLNELRRLRGEGH